MIVYDLCCEHGHRCEGWFDSSEDYRAQAEAGLLTCPVCSSREVHKVPTASRINTGAHPDHPPAAEAPARQFLQELRSYVETNFDDVGARFAEEAKKIHYGETPPRNIRGVASLPEVKELREEGIEALPLPLPGKKRLN